MTVLLNDAQLKKILDQGRLVPTFGVPILPAPLRFVRYVSPKDRQIHYAIACDQDLIDVGAIAANVPSDALSPNANPDCNGGLLDPQQPAEFLPESK